MFATRYTLPAILAASAHLALFFTSSPSRVPVHVCPIRTITPPAPPIPIPPETPTEIEITARPLETGTPVPSLPEPGDPNPMRPEFTVDPVFTPISTLAPIRMIPTHPSLTDGPEGDPSRPHIPALTELDRVPRARAQPAPEYPLTFRASGIQGTAVIHFVVNKSGCVVSAEVVEASQREFGEAAVKAVLRWRFEPGRRQGVPVPFQLSVPIQFSISDAGL